jgi:hypothetical protein
MEGIGVGDYEEKKRQEEGKGMPGIVGYKKAAWIFDETHLL